MILVAGSTGLVGREISRLLLDKKKSVRAIVRKTSNQDLVNDLESRGAEVVIADFKDPASLTAACRNVRSVVSTVSSTFSRQAGDAIDTVDLQGQIALINAAKAAGVRRFVLVSFNHQKAPKCALADAKNAAEQHLMKSGMEYAILRPSVFMEVWLSPALGFDAAAGTATIYGAGKNPISWISLFDVAAFAAEAVEHPSARNQTIEIGGPDALSPLDVVRIFEESTGRKFNVQHVPEEALQAQRAAATDPMQHSFASLMLLYAKGDPIDMSRTGKQFPIRWKSVRDYAKSVTAAR
ncbi:MAG: NmrA family NAD(P)-binding protein [Acidobacteriota bacterium]|nr:NmrA family NAD(P)-binding protein [Acidobacteriota bacterium]